MTAQDEHLEGTAWRRWDLHVHTPDSLKQNYHGPDPWRRFLEELRALPLGTVLGINDYLFVDGYRQVLEAHRKGALPNIAGVFPVVELRIEQLAGTEGHLNRINWHVIFDEGFDPDVIEAQFISGLQAKFQLAPGVEDAVWQGFPSRRNLENLGASIRASSVARKGSVAWSESDLTLGFNNLVVPMEDITRCLQQPALLNRTMQAVGKTEWQSIKWGDSSIAAKKNIINSADVVFVAAATSEAYHAALLKLRDQNVNSRLLDCSDSHNWSDSDDKDRLGNSFTWLNCDPSLDGLRRAIQEFDNRVFVGLEPPKITALRQRPSDFIEVVEVAPKTPLAPNAALFDSSITLNPGFVAVVGNKGKGKSAILDAIGLAGNSHNEEQFSFLTRDRFRDPRTALAPKYLVNARWADQRTSTRGLEEHIDEDSPEEVTYLPQRLLDDICSADPGDSARRFSAQLQGVLFAHIRESERLGCTDLMSYVEARSSALEEKLSFTRAQLTTINQQIAALERKLGQDHQRGLRRRRAVLQEKLNELDAARPAVPAVPQSDDPTLQSLSDETERLRADQQELDNMLEELRTERGLVVSQINSASQLRIATDTIMQQYEAYLQSNAEYAATLGLRPGDLVTLTHNEVILSDRIASLLRRRDEIDAQLDGSNEGSTAARLQSVRTQIRESETRLDEPARRRAAAIQHLEAWEHERRALVEGEMEVEGIRQLDKALGELEGLPDRINQLRSSRIELTRDIHSTLGQVVEIFEEAYKPAARFIRDNDLAAKSGLEFSADLHVGGLSDRFWQIQNRNVAGSFYGVVEGARALDRLVEKADVGTPDGAVALAEELDHALHFDCRSESEPAVDVEKGIRAGHQVEDLYDLVYGLGYLKPYYFLQYSSTPIEKLSPGQKGTLLLLFYLLLDPTRRPLILDQPDENLDNQTINDLLVPAIQEASRNRQVIIVTHNPNVAVVADADQVIVADRLADGQFRYTSGSLEGFEINTHVVDVLEGTRPAFDNRRIKYRPSQPATRSFK